MSSETLYRKYRPKTFEEVKGQDPIVTTLRNQVRTGTPAHAYLFSGTRGTGKTSLAKIFARAINCENGEGGEPCNECETCKSILEGRNLDIQEIDAASNNGVDYIRTITENVSYPPTKSKYKVYIIDEVHMLTGSAFNAFLKTLEDPGNAHVIFILATTELYKIPATIYSRCLSFTFKRISKEVLGEQLLYITSKEGIDIAPEALDLVTTRADGSLRDAISLLDTLVSFSLDKKISYEHTIKVLGIVNRKSLSSMLIALKNHDTKVALEEIEQVIKDGKEVTAYMDDLLWYIRNVLVSRDMSEEALDVSKDNLKEMRALAREISTEQLIWYIKEISKTCDDMKWSSNKRVLTEICLIKLCNPKMNSSQDSYLARLGELEQKIANGQFCVVPREVNQTEEIKTPVVVPEGFSSIEEEDVDAANSFDSKEATPNPFEDEDISLPIKQDELNDDFSKIKSNWKDIVSSLTESPDKSVLKGTSIAPGKGQSVNVFFYDSTRHKLATQGNLKELLRKKTKEKIDVDWEFFLNLKKINEENSNEEKIKQGLDKINFPKELN